MDIDAVYLEACTQPSNINEHLPLLHAYALSCQHITEFGIRSGVSTVCFIHARPLHITSYDVVRNADVAEYVGELAADAIGPVFVSYRERAKRFSLPSSATFTDNVVSDQLQ
jgi:hypothetical protein